jgi:predicted RNA binding protein YcfA (HicA-like mRNA interferase family)
VADFPSMKGRELLGVLMRERLSYEIVRQRGSHRRLKAFGRPPITFAFHDRAEVAPGLVRKIPCRDVGHGEDEEVRRLAEDGTSFALAAAAEDRGCSGVGR